MSVTDDTCSSQAEPVRGPESHSRHLRGLDGEERVVLGHWKHLKWMYGCRVNRGKAKNTVH